MVPVKEYVHHTGPGCAFAVLVPVKEHVHHTGPGCAFAVLVPVKEQHVHHTGPGCALRYCAHELDGKKDGNGRLLEN